MSIIKQIGRLTAQCDEQPDGTLVFTLTVPQDHPVDKANFEQLLRELVGAVHDVMIIWNVL